MENKENPHKEWWVYQTSKQRFATSTKPTNPGMNILAHTIEIEALEVERARSEKLVHALLQIEGAENNDDFYMETLAREAIEEYKASKND